MATNKPKQDPKAPADADPAAGAPAGEVSERTYPWVTRVTNNTPIPIYLSETGSHLAANYYPDRSTAVVTYQTGEHFAREMANIDAIASVHGFSDPLIFSAPESETPDPETTK